MDLLETVNNVLKDLSPKDHSVDVRDEPIERTAQRIFADKISIHIKINKTIQPQFERIGINVHVGMI